MVLRRLPRLPPPPLLLQVSSLVELIMDALRPPAVPSLRNAQACPRPARATRRLMMILCQAASMTHGMAAPPTTRPLASAGLTLPTCLALAQCPPAPPARLLRWQPLLPVACVHHSSTHRYCHPPAFRCRPPHLASLRRTLPTRMPRQAPRRRPCALVGKAPAPPSMLRMMDTVMMVACRPATTPARLPLPPVCEPPVLVTLPSWPI